MRQLVHLETIGETRAYVLLLLVPTRQFYWPEPGAQIGSWNSFAGSLLKFFRNLEGERRNILSCLVRSAAAALTSVLQTWLIRIFPGVDTKHL